MYLLFHSFYVVSVYVFLGFLSTLCCIYFYSFGFSFCCTFLLLCASFVFLSLSDPTLSLIRSKKTLSVLTSHKRKTKNEEKERKYKTREKNAATDGYKCSLFFALLIFPFLLRAKNVEQFVSFKMTVQSGWIWEQKRKKIIVQLFFLQSHYSIKLYVENCCSPNI